MNAEQRGELLSRLQVMLGEHCVSFAVCVEVEDGDDATVTMHTWGGGFNRGLGCAARMLRRMEDEDRQANGAPPPPEDGEEWKYA